MNGLPAVLIIDDHAVVRAGCRLLLQQCQELRVIEAGSGAEGLCLNLENRPGLIVLDIGLQDYAGLDILAKLKTDNPETRILIFTMHEDPVFAARALERGAQGYVTKSDGPDCFVEAITEILCGRPYLSRSIAQKIALMNIRLGDHPLHSLTSREIDVLQLLGSGKGLAEIAGALGVSYRTVANTVSIVKRKLNAATTGQLLQIAIEHMRPR
jgi:DNA-binding NarL/FixJ family response regulator